MKYYIELTQDAEDAMDILDLPADGSGNELTNEQELSLLRRVYDGITWELVT